LKSGGFRRESILADTLEALIGAIYLDADMETARDRVLAWLANELDGLTLVDTNKDPKTRLQEFLQSRACELPRYEVVAIQGEPHCRTFFVECQVALLSDKTHGQGASRRIAEQVAAASALIALGAAKGQERRNALGRKHRPLWLRRNCPSPPCRQGEVAQSHPLP